MPEMEVEFEVICECGNGLCANTRVSRNRGMNQVVIEPCEKCLNREFEKGKDLGDTEGYDRATAKYSTESEAQL